MTLIDLPSYNVNIFLLLSIFTIAVLAKVIFELLISVFSFKNIFINSPFLFFSSK